MSETAIANIIYSCTAVFLVVTLLVCRWAERRSKRITRELLEDLQEILGRSSHAQ